MAVSTRQEFLDVLARSNLLTDEQLRKAEELAAVTGDPRTVAKRIVQAGWLTRWQAQQLLAGRTKLFLGKYKLLDGLGQGGMGAVFKAEQPGLKRTVALKMMSRDVLGNPDAVERFMREIQLAAALQHPNIVRAFDADRVGSTYFLVMEYVDGDELRAWIRQHGMLPAAWSCEVIRQAAWGLQHAHENGLAHRDIKPTNFLIVRRPDANGGQGVGNASHIDGLPQVKLLDMGLAKFVSETQEEGGLTKTGQIMGTPDYIAPEQAQNTRAADIRSDIFSLGCTLFEMLTGRLPFTGSGLMEKLMARTMHDAPRVRTLRPEVSPELDGLVAKMLARDPQQRFQTPGELAVALAPFALATMPAVPQPTVLAQPSQHRESKKVEARADTTLNRFLHELDDRVSATPPSSPAPAIQIKETGDRPDSKIQRKPAPVDRRWLTVGGIAAGVLLLGLIWISAGRGGKETPIHPPPVPPDTNHTETIPPAVIDKTVVENDDTTVGPPPKDVEPDQSSLTPDEEPESLGTVLPNGWVVGSFEWTGPTSGAGGPCLSPDNLTLFFHSSVLPGHGANDLWMCTRTSVDEPFGEPTNLGPEVNGTSEDTDACLSADGLTLLCSRWDRNWDLWTYTRSKPDEPWTGGVKLAAPINTPKSEKGPTLTSDGLTLIFDTDREGGLGSNDLWMSERVTTDEPFGPPVPLGEAVNSTVNDHDPAISADGLTLLFMSDRAQGAGGTWMCTRPNRDAPFGPAVSLGPDLGGEPFLSYDDRLLMLNSRQAAVTVPAPLPNGWVFGAPVNLGPAINGSDHDSGPSLSADGLMLVFDSVRPSGSARDLWIATRTKSDEPFGDPKNLGPAVNTSNNDASPCVSADGLSLVFMRKNASGEYELWASTRANGTAPWDESTKLDPSVAAGSDPWISADATTLLLSAESSGGRGGPDVWMSTRERRGVPWRDPVNLGEAINSSFSEQGPCLSSDGLTLLFASDRDGGYGELDLWISTRESADKPFGPPVNLGPTVNTAANEGSPELSADGRILLFDSDRSGGRGGRDIYKSTITVQSPQSKDGLGTSPTDAPQSPKPNYALHFDGKTSYVEIPTLKFDYSQPLTIEATVRGGGGITGENYIVTNGTHNPLAPQRVALRHAKGGSDPGSWRFDASARLAVFGASAASGTAYENSIVRLAGVWDGTRARLFVNGKLVATMEQPTEIDGLPPAGPFRIGAANNKTSEPFYGYIGTIDEVRISNVVRYDHDYRPRDRFEPDEHTLALYHFDEGRGYTLTDWSGNGHHGTIHGAAWSARDGSPLPLPGDYALNFDGKTGHVEIPTLRWDDGPMTVEAFFVPAEEPIDASIVQVRGTGELHLWDRGETGVGFEVNRLGLATGMDPTPRSSGRHHLAGVFDGARLHFYLDGTLIRKRLVRRGTDAIDVAGATIAAMHDLSNPEQVVKPFAGLLDELRISKVARYDANFTPTVRFEPDAGTLALYHFDEAAGDVLVDASGNHHHGRIVGAEWVNADGSPLGTHQLAVAPFDAEQAKQFQERWATDLGRDVEIVNSIGMKLRLIPPGEYLMGAGPEELQMLLEGNTDPQEIERLTTLRRRHWVRITRAYYLSALEVTNRQWQQVMFDQTATNDEAKGLVTRKQAAEFCERLSQLPAEQQAGRRYRLPTEAEWEYACRAGTTTAFAFGDTLTAQQADIQAPGRTPTQPGEFPPNAWGLYDMHGRKREWCADWYADDYYGRSPVEDPPGPEKSPTGKRVLRGGSSAHPATAAMSASRAAYDVAHADFGLRVVCEIVEAQKDD